MEKLLLLLGFLFVSCVISKSTLYPWEDPSGYEYEEDNSVETTSSSNEYDSSLPNESLLFGDKCETTRQCGFKRSVCFNSNCVCSFEFSSTNHIDKCGKTVAVGENCFFNEQCEDAVPETECRDGRCICRFDKIAVEKNDGSQECITTTPMKVKEQSTLPTNSSSTFLQPSFILSLCSLSVIAVGSTVIKTYR